MSPTRRGYDTKRLADGQRLDPISISAEPMKVMGHLSKLIENRLLISQKWLLHMPLNVAESSALMLINFPMIADKVRLTVDGISD